MTVGDVAVWKRACPPFPHQQCHVVVDLLPALVVLEQHAVRCEVIRIAVEIARIQGVCIPGNEIHDVQPILGAQSITLWHDSISPFAREICS